MLASLENARNATFERHTRSQSKNWTFSNSMHTTKLFAHDLLKGPKKQTCACLIHKHKYINMVGSARIVLMRLVSLLST